MNEVSQQPGKEPWAPCRDRLYGKGGGFYLDLVNLRDGVSVNVQFRQIKAWNNSARYGGRRLHCDELA